MKPAFPLFFKIFVIFPIFANKCPKFQNIIAHNKSPFCVPNPKGKNSFQNIISVGVPHKVDVFVPQSCCCWKQLAPIPSGATSKPKFQKTWFLWPKTQHFLIAPSLCLIFRHKNAKKEGTSWPNTIWFYGGFWGWGIQHTMNRHSQLAHGEQHTPPVAPKCLVSLPLPGICPLVFGGEGDFSGHSQNRITFDFIGYLGSNQSSFASSRFISKLA